LRAVQKHPHYHSSGGCRYLGHSRHRHYKPGHGLPEEITDAIVIFVIVLACVVLGVVEEFRSEKAMAALKKMAALTATVIRDGKDIEVPAGK